MTGAAEPVGELARIFITVGALFLAALAIETLGARTRLPRVTLLLVFGAAIGPSGLGLLPDLERAWFPFVSHLALLMVGFLLGESMSLARLREHGRAVLTISLAVVGVTSLIVALGLWALGVPAAVALVLGGIAPATDPAATREVVREAGADGPFTRTLLGIVAIDDAWGLLVFGVLLGVAHVVSGGDGLSAAGSQLYAVGGGVALGAALGVPIAKLTGRIRTGEPTLIEALGAVLLCGGLALWLEVSFLLAAMTLGAVVSNVAMHHTRPFRAIENVEWPFMVLFFVGAGASLELSVLQSLGVAGVGYLGLRAVGRLAGVWLGARACSAPSPVQRYMGIALMPQAGVALGMALVASQRLPEVAEVVLPLVIASTVVFEIGGPILARRAIEGAGEAG